MGNCIKTFFKVATSVNETYPCSTDMRWFVFMTDFPIVSKSRGLKLLRLITSASIPLPANSLAASRDVSTALECATIVMCLPKNKKLIFSINQY